MKTPELLKYDYDWKVKHGWLEDFGSIPPSEDITNVWSGEDGYVLIVTQQDARSYELRTLGTKQTLVLLDKANELSMQQRSYRDVRYKHNLAIAMLDQLLQRHILSAITTETAHGVEIDVVQPISGHTICTITMESSWYQYPDVNIDLYDAGRKELATTISRIFDAKVYISDILDSEWDEVAFLEDA